MMTVTFVKNRKKKPKKKRKPGAGRPPADIAPDTLRQVASLCCSVEEAAAFFGVTPNTLYSRLRDQVFRDAWNQGWDRGKLGLRRKQISVAMGGNPQMLIFLGKQLLGQSDKAHLIVGGDRSLNLSMLDSELVTIPWTADVDKELTAIGKLIDLGAGEYHEDT